MDFSFASTPHLHFGPGQIGSLPAKVKLSAAKVLMVTGAVSFMSSPRSRALLEAFDREGLEVKTHPVDQEPTPAMVDAAIDSFAEYAPDVVIAIGGGSVLDAGKAISAMLPLREPVKQYLEGVGSKSHAGVKLPFIAVPTTAGTGSEATRNAVLSEIGTGGFKRSLRHNNFVPNMAIVDPELIASCPQQVTATSGMDAFTQLLEAYVSTAANPITDALALEGLKGIRCSLFASFRDGFDLQARADMALAAYLSGVVLTSAGLGLVHGFASSVGARYPVSHGAICSALMGPVNLVTVRKLRKEKAEEALGKYVAAGKIFANKMGKARAYYVDSLLDAIASLTVEMKIPSLTKYGVVLSEAREIALRTDNKNHPTRMTDEERTEIIELACQPQLYR